jgi:hypothetical protein
MKKKRSNKNKFFLTTFSIIVLGVGYLYFANELRTGNILNIAQGSLASSTNEEASSASTNNSSLNSKISADISFLSTLASLKNIKIDLSFFENKLFTKLKSNSVSIGTAIPGRPNPFAPIDETSVARNVIKDLVITNQATQITDKTAVLNGTLGSLSGVTDTYFEYGETESLGNSTTMVKQQSLVGSFVKNILNLKSKTVYFYKACAKINGISVCGDIVSFATN